MRTSLFLAAAASALFLASCAASQTTPNTASDEAPTTKRTELSVAGEPKDAQQKAVYCFFDKFAEGDASKHPYYCERAKTAQEEKEKDPLSMETCNCIDEMTPKLEEYQKNDRSYLTPEGQLIATNVDVWRACGMQITNEHTKVDLASMKFETLEANDSEAVVDAEWTTDSVTSRGRFFLKKDREVWRIRTSVML